MLDQLSNGRLDVGLGRGISPIESRLFANDPEQAQRILDECRTIVLTALSNGRVEHRGEMFTFENVEMSVAPFQKPHPPLWYGTSSAETAERCAKSGFHLINNDVGERARDVASRYATECERQGNMEYRSGLTRYIVVADTDSDAFEIGRSAYPSWHRSFVALYRKYGRGPVTGERDPEFAAHVDTGKAVVGSPETVARILREQLSDIGFNYVVGQFAFGNMPIATAIRSVELFGSRVMPRISECVGVS